jgi:predicted nuclease with TOPRIM domain
VRLTDEKIADVKEYLARSMKVTASSLIPQLSKYGLDLIDAIESLQQENEQLRAKLEDWKHEVQCHMDEVVARDKEIEKLRGEWKPIFKGADTCECSVCKSKGFSDSDFGFIATPYCPNCGAEMEVEP